MVRTAASAGSSAARGFTIIEAMIVVTIAAILAMAAMPAYNDFVKNQRVKNASFDLFTALVLARSEAVTRNTSVTVTPTSSNWANGWTVASGGTTIRTQDPMANITISGPASVTYNGTGRLSAALASGFQLTATATDGTKQIQTRCIKVDLSGRPTTIVGACT